MDIPEDSVFMQQLAAVIQQLCDTNSDLRSVNPTIFDSVARPSMTIHSYLVRIRRYTKFDTVCFLVALAYLRKLCSQHCAPFCVTHHNIHRLLITSVLASSKANDGAHLLRHDPFGLVVRARRHRSSARRSPSAVPTCVAYRQPPAASSQTSSMPMCSWRSAEASPTRS